LSTRYNYTFTVATEAAYKRNKRKLEGRGKFITRSILKAFSRVVNKNVDKRSNSAAAQE
jgi:hypothetical protein